MGLAERRAMKAVEDGEYPGLAQKVEAALGFDVEIDVDWDALAVDDYDHMYSEMIAKVFFEPMTKAFGAICVDDMGRDALKGALKTIRVRNETDNSSASRWAAFDDGVLTLDHKPDSNIDYVDDRAKALQELLENKL